MGWSDPEVSKESWKVTWEKMGGKRQKITDIGDAVEKSEP